MTVEEPLGGIKPRAVGEIALLDRRIGGIEPGFAQRIDEAALALCAGHMPRMTANQADTAMAKLDQMARDRFGRTVIVDPDVERVGRLPAARDRDDGNSSRGKLGVDRSIFGNRRSQDDAFDIARHKGASRGGLFLRGLARAHREHHVTTGTARALQRADQELRQIGVRWIGIEQADMRRVAGRQRPCRRIG